MDNIDGTLPLTFYARFLLLTFFVLIVYTFLFKFYMLACCVNHLNSLKARLVSEHFGGNKD